MPYWICGALINIPYPIVLKYEYPEVAVLLAAICILAAPATTVTEHLYQPSPKSTIVAFEPKEDWTVPLAKLNTAPPSNIWA